MLGQNGIDYIIVFLMIAFVILIQCNKLKKIVTKIVFENKKKTKIL